MKAIVYSRVSTDAQERDGTSLETQERACIARAEELGWQVVRTIRDHVSGAVLERDGLTDLRNALRRGEGNVVVAVMLLIALRAATGVHPARVRRMKRSEQDSDVRAVVRAVTRAIYFRDTAALVTTAFVVVAFVVIGAVVVGLVVLTAIGIVAGAFVLPALIATGGVSVVGMVLALRVVRAIGNSIDAFKDETKSPRR